MRRLEGEGRQAWIPLRMPYVRPRDRRAGVVVELVLRHDSKLRILKELPPAKGELVRGDVERLAIQTQLREVGPVGRRRGPVERGVEGPDAPLLCGISGLRGRDQIPGALPGGVSRHRQEDPAIAVLIEEEFGIERTDP